MGPGLALWGQSSVRAYQFEPRSLLWLRLSSAVSILSLFNQEGSKLFIFPFVAAMAGQSPEVIRSFPGSRAFPQARLAFLQRLTGRFWVFAHAFDFLGLTKSSIMMATLGTCPYALSANPIPGRHERPVLYDDSSPYHEVLADRNLESLGHPIVLSILPDFGTARFVGRLTVLSEALARSLFRGRRGSREPAFGNCTGTNHRVASMIPCRHMTERLSELAARLGGSSYGIRDDSHIGLPYASALSSYCAVFQNPAESREAYDRSRHLHVIGSLGYDPMR